MIMNLIFIALKTICKSKNISILSFLAHKASEIDPIQLENTSLILISVDTTHFYPFPVLIMSLNIAKTF